MDPFFSSDNAGLLIFALLMLSGGLYFMKGAVVSGVKALGPRTVVGSGAPEQRHNGSEHH